MERESTECYENNNLYISKKNYGQGTPLNFRLKVKNCRDPICLSKTVVFEKYLSFQIF